MPVNPGAVWWIVAGAIAVVVTACEASEGKPPGPDAGPCDGGACAEAGVDGGGDAGVDGGGDAGVDGGGDAGVDGGLDAGDGRVPDCGVGGCGDGGAMDCGAEGDSGVCVDAGGDGSVPCPPGSAGPLCEVCEPGNFCAGGDAPSVPCAAGHWDDDADPATTCIAHRTCVAGQYVVDVGSALVDTSCEDCEAGTFSTGEDTPSCLQWTDCVPGEYVSQDGTSTADRLCGVCADGTTTREPNAPQCVAQCEPGEYVLDPAASTREQRCASCPAGFTSTILDSDRCGIPFDELDVFDSSFCAIRSDDGRAICWGNNAEGVASEVPALALTQISVGWDHACGLVAGSGEATCWGFGPSPPIGTPFSRIAVGLGLSCGVISGSQLLDCWGVTSGVPLGVEATDVALGFLDSASIASGCIVRADDGHLQCWGSYDLGGLLSEVPASAVFSQVELGQGFGCALRAADERLQCWGLDDRSVLPVAMRDVAFSQVALYRSSGCARRKADGHWMCWGADGSDPAVADAPTERSFDRLALTHRAGCGLDRGGLLQCWGDDAQYVISGEPRPGHYTDVHMIGSYAHCARRESDGGLECYGIDTVHDPPQFPPGVEYVAHAVGPFAACGIRASDSQLDCVGDVPLDSWPTEPVSAVAAGSDHFCALRTSDRHVRCWGRDPGGYGTVSDAPTSVAIDAIDASGSRTCAVRSDDGRPMCWGRDAEGVVTHEVPGLVTVAVGWSHGCGLNGEGDVLCWPLRSSSTNEFGELTPPPGVSFSAVAVGDRTTCGLSEVGGRPSCWGLDTLFQTSSTPTSTSMELIRSEASTTCGIRSSDHSVTCWGIRVFNPR